MYTDDLAEKLKKRAGQKWRPSNGTEGEMFMEAFCYKCLNDDIAKDCDILLNSMLYDTDDDRYPKEMQIDKDGQPTCIAFKKDTRLIK